MEPLQNILICRTDAIGDALLTLPLVTALKRAWPYARITFLASEYAAGMIERQTGVDEVWTYSALGEHRGWAGRRELSRRIFQARFDAAFLVFPDPRISWAVFSAGVPQRIGTGRRWWSFLYTHPVRISRARGGRHEADFNLDLVRALGVAAELTPTSLRVWPEAERWAQVYLQNKGSVPATQWIAVHPGGRGSAANWPLTQYRGLVQQLVRWPQTRVLLTGSMSEQRALHEVAEGCEVPPVILDEPVTLPQLAALLARMKVVVSGNTGPMHIAAGVGTPTVSFFPPAGVTGPERWSPLGNRQVLLSPPVTDAGVNMQAIPVDRAAAAVLEILKTEGSV